MRKIVICVIVVAVICVFIAGCITTSNFGKSPIRVTYYYSPGCGPCEKLSSEFATLEKNYGVNDLVITRYDVNKEADKFREDLNKYHRDSVTPFVIIGNTTYSGYNETISYDIEQLIKLNNGVR